MNKKELSKFKKGFNVNYDIEVIGFKQYYCKKKESGLELIFSKETNFNDNDDEIKEKYYKSIKKLLTGAFGNKIFELDFNGSTEAINTQKKLIELLKVEDFEELSGDLVNDLIKNINYGRDVVFTTIVAHNHIEFEKDKCVSYPFMICSVNSINKSDKELVIDTTTSDFPVEESNFIINLKQPIEGFIFPSISDGSVNVNKLLYSACSTNCINEELVVNVLHCDTIFTAKEERAIFDTVLRETIGDKIPFNKMANIINNINDINKDDENKTISIKKLGDILESNGITNANSVLSKMVPDTTMLINTNNIVPKQIKGLKLKNTDITVSVGVEGISKISKSIKDGKKCLVIQLADDVDLDGIQLI